MAVMTILYKCFKRIELFLKRFYMTVSITIMCVFFWVMMNNPDAKYGRYLLQVIEANQEQTNKVFVSLDHTVTRLDSTVRILNMAQYAYKVQSDAAWRIFNENDSRLSSDVNKLKIRMDFYSGVVADNTKKIEYLIKVCQKIDSTSNPDAPSPQQQGEKVIIREREWIKSR